MNGRHLKAIIEKIPDDCVLRFAFAEKFNVYASVDICSVELSNDGTKLFFVPSRESLAAATANLPPDYIQNPN